MIREECLLTYDVLDLLVQGKPDIKDDVIRKLCEGEGSYAYDCLRETLEGLEDRRIVDALDNCHDSGEKLWQFLKDHISVDEENIAFDYDETYESGDIRVAGFCVPYIFENEKPEGRIAERKGALIISSYYRGSTDRLTGLTFNTESKTYRTWQLASGQWTQEYKDGGNVFSAAKPGFKMPGDLVFYHVRMSELEEKVRELTALQEQAPAGSRSRGASLGAHVPRQRPSLRRQGRSCTFLRPL